MTTPTTYKTKRLEIDGTKVVSIDGIGEVTDPRTTDPDGEEETVVSLLRAILYRLENGIDVSLL